MDEEYHGRELRRLEQKAAKQRTSTTSSGPATFDDLATFDNDLASRRAKSGTKEVRAVYAGHSRPPSAKALGELDLIDLTSLYLNEQAKGACILLRVLSSPVALSDPLYINLVLPVASPSGHCTFLRLNAYPLLPASLGRPREDDLQAVFPEGAVLAVKEPFLARDLLSDDLGIDLDSPADVVTLSMTDKILEGVRWTGKDGTGWSLPPLEDKSVNEWSYEGEQDLQTGRYRRALRSYSLGIAQYSSDAKVSRLLARRATLNLQLERFTQAILDAEAAMSSNEGNTVKMLLVKAQALYSLRRWSHALVAYQQSLESDAQSTPAQEGVVACHARLREVETGKYDISALYQTALDGPSGGVASITHAANHIGPVKIGASTTGGGRGLFTTRDVQPGEVLLGIKSIASASISDLPTSPRLVVYNLQRSIVDASSPLVYVQNVLWRLMDQPELASKVYGLFLGNEDGVALADLDLPAPTEAVQGPARLDSQAIFSASFWNASTAFKVLPIPEIRGDVIEYSVEAAPGALFSESAMINHSCTWTVSHTFFGDFQITRASQFLPAGTEVFASYVPDLPLAFRQPRLAKFFGGVCQCELCQADSLDTGVRERTDKVIKFIRETSEDEEKFLTVKGEEATSNSQLAAIVKRRTELSRELDGTYSPSREMPKVDLFFAWEALRAPLRAIAERKGKEKELLAWGRNELRALISLGVDFTDESVMGLSTPSLFPETASLPSKSLPIRTPPAFRPVEATRSLLLLASISDKIAHLPSATPVSVAKWTRSSEEWLKAAIFVEGVVIGGGTTMFGERWSQVIHFEGLDEVFRALESA